MCRRLGMRGYMILIISVAAFYPIIFAFNIRGGRPMYQYLATWGIFLVWEIYLIVAMVLAYQKKRFYKFLMPIAYIWLTIGALISIYVFLNCREFGVLAWIDFPEKPSNDPYWAVATLFFAFIAFMGQYWYVQYLKAKIRRRGPE